MPEAHDTDNYTLGKGICYFNKQEADGSYLGERDLGNAPELTFSIDITKLDHYSSRGGIRAKDKTVVTEITPTLAFTLDEVNEDNLALLTFGEITEVVQAESLEEQQAITEAHLGLFVELNHRNVGGKQLVHGTVTAGPFVVGETITGGTSSATADVIEVGSNYLLLENEAGGPFQAAETITGGTSGASATVTTIPAFISGYVVVCDDTESTYYVRGTDFTVEAGSGRIKLLSTGSIVEDEELIVKYAAGATTYSVVNVLAETEVEGAFRFVSDNPVGTQLELEIWRVNLAPAGDTAMIGDDWSTLSFEGEILKDEENHPSNPYMNIIF